MPRPPTLIEQLPEEYLAEHYATDGERAIDAWIHGVALALACAGSAWLVWVAATAGRPTLVVATGLYGAALIAMLAFSALYNMSRVSTARPFLRRLDEAGIFLMIAGSYTPFTTLGLHGAWSVGMTTLVWTIAAGGIVGKLAFTRVSERVWTAVYVLFGWVAVLALRPLSQSLPIAVMALLVAGGLVYTGGSLIFLNPRLPFRRAVWHGFVCAGAALHYGAILGLVLLLPGPR